MKPRRVFALHPVLTGARGLRSSGRRRFVQLAALGGGASLLAALSGRPRAGAAVSTEALLLTCMDFRLLDEIERYMSARGLRRRYEHLLLAGASLGALTDRYPEGGKTFWHHLDEVLKQHELHSVIVIDHRDCGAYRVILGHEHASNAELEKRAHAVQLRKLKGLIGRLYPALKVETLLMSLDGQVEALS